MSTKVIKLYNYLSNLRMCTLIKVALLFPVDTPRMYSSSIKLEKRMATKYAQLQLVCPVITSCPCRTHLFSKWESNCSLCHLYTHIIALRDYNFVFTLPQISICIC